jgi:hypothetical protein
MDGVAELVVNNGVFAANEEKAPKTRRSMDHQNLFRRRIFAAGEKRVSSQLCLTGGV